MNNPNARKLVERSTQEITGMPGLDIAEPKIQQEATSLAIAMFVNILETPQTSLAKVSSVWPQWEKTMREELEQLREMEHGN